MEPPVAQLPVDTEFHSASAANPTPSHAPNTSGGNHPPYAEMITTAISALRENGGSSKKAITKYIDRVYTNLPASHSALLTHHLKRLTSTGQLVMVKKSYMLPGSITEGNLVNPSSSLPKRGRGRPPKLKPVPAGAGVPFVQPNSVGPVVDNGHGNGPTLSKKRPGRPPKPKTVGLAVVPLYPEVQAQENPGLVGAGLVNGSVIPKRRGRPPKSKVVGTLGSDTGGGITLAQQSLDGSMPVVQPIISPRRRGRPKKAKVAFGAQVMPGGAPSGRPPKKAKFVASGVGVGGLGVVGRKRRGRPPKIGGLQPSMRSSGRPLGRPKKGTETAMKHASGVAVELMRKLEFMQACIKSAVSVLKPYVTHENAIDAVTALQRLEEVATMNVSPAPEVLAPPPAPELVPPPAPVPVPTWAPEPALEVAPAAPVSMTVVPPIVDNQQLHFSHQV
ncbi:hypothetical protein Ancab_038704 [Ancistrocladus abbreviatus]